MLSTMPWSKRYRSLPSGTHRGGGGGVFYDTVTSTILITSDRTQGLYSLKRERLIGKGIPITNLRRSSDRLRFIMGFIYSQDGVFLVNRGQDQNTAIWDGTVEWMPGVHMAVASNRYYDMFSWYSRGGGGGGGGGTCAKMQQIRNKANSRIFCSSRPTSQLP